MFWLRNKINFLPSHYVVSMSKTLYLLFSTGMKEPSVNIMFWYGCFNLLSAGVQGTDKLCKQFESKKEGKDQESIQSSTAPDPGYQWEIDDVTPRSGLTLPTKILLIILMGKRELIALLNLSSWCLVMVERLFLTVPRGCLQFVIVVFPDHTHLLFFLLIIVWIQAV